MNTLIAFQSQISTSENVDCPQFWLAIGKQIFKQELDLDFSQINPLSKSANKHKIF
jgi:hypothetical protein